MYAYGRAVLVIVERFVKNLQYVSVDYARDQHRVERNQRGGHILWGRGIRFGGMKRSRVRPIVSLKDSVS
jgi:hypothetical protein